MSTPARSQNEVEAQFVWHVLDDGLNVISISNFNGEQWSEPLKLYETERVIASAAIGSDKLGNKLLVWTEQTENKSVLMQKWYSAERKIWSDDTLLSDFGTENIGATIVFDLNNRAWVFWSENGVGLSDIVGINKDPGGSWSKPFQVNQENTVPDITPNAFVNELGEIVLTWLSYSFEQSDYIEITKIIDSKPASPDTITTTLTEERLILDSVAAPSFAPDNAASLLHFPKNSMLQSLVVSAPSKLEQ